MKITIGTYNKAIYIDKGLVFKVSFKFKKRTIGFMLLGRTHSIRFGFGYFLDKSKTVLYASLRGVSIIPRKMVNQRPTMPVVRHTVTGRPHDTNQNHEERLVREARERIADMRQQNLGNLDRIGHALVNPRRPHIIDENLINTMVQRMAQVDVPEMLIVPREDILQVDRVTTTTPATTATETNLLARMPDAFIHDGVVDDTTPR